MDPNKVKIKTKTDKYEENCDSELTWKDEVNLEIDNILNDYNPAEVFVAEVKESKRIYEE